jgi:AraC family transcriptional regulator
MRVTATMRVASRAFFELAGLEIRKELRSSQLRLWDFASKATVRLPTYRHESAHFSVLLRGRMSCSCSRQPYSPWVGVFHPPGVEHSIQFFGARSVTLEVGKRWLDRLNDHAPVPNAAVVLESQSRWISTRLVDEFRHLRPASILVLEGLTAQLLASAARAAEETADRPPLWLLAVLERLHTSFDGHFQLNELAAEFQVHPTRLSQAFQRYTGRTLGGHVRELRVRFLLERLAASDLPLVELALAAGFSDQSHCTREFKKATGMTPAAYRRLLRAGAVAASAPETEARDVQLDATQAGE